MTAQTDTTDLLGHAADAATALPQRRLWLFRRVMLASVRVSDRIWPDPRQRLRLAVSPLRLRQLVSQASLLLAVRRELILWKKS